MGAEETGQKQLVSGCEKLLWIVDLEQWKQ